MRITHVFSGVILSILLIHQGYAIAPVVDESENFAVFDDEGVRAPANESLRDNTQIATRDDVPIAKMLPAEDKSQDESLPGQVRAMQQEIQALRGELEVQAHTIELLKQQQMTFYKDMDQRLQQFSTGKPPVVSKTVPDEPMASPMTAVPVVKTGTINPADEQVAYLAAYDLVKAKRYDSALSAMQSFVSQYPTGGYTANAEYWMGELYLAKSMPTDAMKHFEVVLSRFPNSSKAAASALKIGYALSALGKNEEAKLRLREVIKNYPDTAAAQLAKSKMESM